ncbi:hypothetical protein QUO16_004458 [Vibrio parahaemolyticus]|uniref:hypothetical protein n=1 Tax=Vibrio parahaemolyticus TaxID=670 RepID=UPI000A39C1E8|nr:hypothetical protein [Vibrio parahaemolyticus]MCU8247359.1 hypothetical protein [Vibrio vulnificus]ELA9373135.1 hypothetical protein [Vibrio parahaemolyticus]MBE3718822.1 hypothetical protein [Vibrio parahaemolyticus]OUJ48324.1 hypothetical protein BTM22_24335 [Vibrio parahaemolyticus]TOE56114.1 hypothetical protein CGJ40_24185 [Vibrio parahaemolyticus]
MEINTDFEKMSFHDVSIEDVSRIDSNIIMVLSGVFISKDHPSSNGNDLIVRNGLMTLYNVSNEKSLTWLDVVAPVPHETPEHPIDEIMHAEFDGSTFHFDGFKETMPWHEWFIQATSFNLLALEVVETTS